MGHEAEMSGENLREVRRRSGLSYAGFARAIGVGKASISRYENGLQPIPRKVELAVFGYLNGPCTSPEEA